MLKALDGGSDINSRNEFGKTALQCAVAESNQEMARILLERGADVLNQDRNGDTVLQYAREYE
ncbi:MAG: ankyrin repeat domain-containing protein [Planctomycetes bacterium]|nr:ankyrin repeat domain-containing protein [Planctomycetota bacterium]